MNPRLLLDTHILARWILDPKRLSTDQARALAEAARRREAVVISAMTLLELAMLLAEGKIRVNVTAHQLLTELESNPDLQVVPLDFAVAAEVVNLVNFRGDPADRAIVATARSRNLKLLTSDQRIIQSNLVPVIE